MTLYIETDTDVFTRWNGERIDGILYPLQIENLWSDEALSELNLYKPVADDAVPEGKRVVSTEVQRVEGVVKYINTLEDYVEPIPNTVSRRQAKLALHDAGLLSLIEPALQTLSEPQRTTAIIEWEDALEFKRDYSLITSLASSLNLTSKQIDLLFIQASKL